MFDWLSNFRPQAKPPPVHLPVGTRSVPLQFVHHARARRYVLRLRADGVAQVTVPRNGSLARAKAFAFSKTAWLERQFHLRETSPIVSSRWHPGTEIYFRGELVPLQLVADGQIHFGAEQLAVPDASADLQPLIQKHLRQLAARELPARVMELAASHHVQISRITVRNQKSRWGSCSRRGTISLNWRLLQTPAFVRDYIILHELAHRRHMNHSRKFWDEVEKMCTDYPAAERWLKTHAKLLLV